MFKTVLPALLAAALAASSMAAAEDRSSQILDMLTLVPAASFEDRVQIEFGDTRALLPLLLLSDQATNATLLAYARGAPSDISQYAMMQKDAMEGLVGFAQSDVRFTLQAHDLPQRFTVFELEAGATAQIAPALAANGYTPEARQAYPSGRAGTTSASTSHRAMRLIPLGVPLGNRHG